jgi:asparagine synthase (glutamine-hydrolysing)
MCGIFGIKYSNRGRSVQQQMLVEATDLMSHRGPDDSGYWIKGGVGLGHRRLSIIDLSPLGHQPMFNEDGEVGLVFNGEIYNYRELYQPLCDLGHRFRSKSDTEVIIHAYEQWGFDCLQHFNGMFAFGLWDERKQSLWVVRDRLGIKPLYYFWDEQTFIFSSEIKPILKTGVLKAEMNEGVLDAYFSLGYVPGPETMFKGIKKLAPGHFLCLRDGKLTDTEYWDFASVDQVTLSAARYEEKLEALLRDAISLRLRSDVPLGVFLSGGLDSSAVVALMSDTVSEPINTFTVGYDPEKNLSEEPFADMVATRFQTKHHVFKLEPDNFLLSVEKLVEFAEEPIVEPAAIALYHLSLLARKSATVLLSGEGSDEILAGYYLYHIMQKIDGLRGVLPVSWLQAARTVAGLGTRLKFAKYGDWLNLSLEDRYQGTSGYLTETMKKRLYCQDFFAAKGDYLQETYSALFSKVAHKSDALSKMLYVDAKTWLVDDLLLKADKMTMAASIELRVPFLDYRMVEMAASFPSGVKLQAGNGKAILKSIMRNKLPQMIVNRKKMGFPVPVADWFKNDLSEVLGSMEVAREVGRWMNPACIADVMRSRHNGDNARIIMSLLVLKAWQDKFLSGP